MFYDPKSFKFITELGQSVDQIQAELKSLGRDVLDIHRNRRVDEFFALLQRTKNGWTPSWQVSSFAPPSLAGSSQYWELDSSEPNYNWLTYAITYDRKFLAESEHKYPATRALLDHDAVRVAGFSLLKGLSIIAPHDHPELGNGILTSHLGIDLTPGSSYLNVDGVFEEEREGKAIVFDGSRRHFALNAGWNDRVVLYVEFDSSKA